MNRGQDHPLALPVELFKVQRRRRFRHLQQRIDHGVAGDGHRTDHPRAPQIGFGLGRRREMKTGDLRQQAPVGFLGKWVEQIIRAQPGFNVADRDLLVKGSQSRRKSRGGIALHQNHGWWISLKVIPQPLKSSTGDVGERLPGGHQSEITVSLKAEEIHDLGHHFTMLARQHHPGSQGSATAKGANHRSQFDGLRPCPQNDRDAGQRNHGTRNRFRILRTLQGIKTTKQTLETCRSR